MEDQDGTAIRELDAKVKGITVEFRAWDADVMRFLESNKSTAFIPIDVYPYHLSSKTALPQSALHTITTHAASPAAALALSNQWKEQESWARDRRNAGFYSAQRLKAGRLGKTFQTAGRYSYDDFNWVVLDEKAFVQSVSGQYIRDVEVAFSESKQAYFGNLVEQHLCSMKLHLRALSCDTHCKVLARSHEHGEQVELANKISIMDNATGCIVGAAFTASAGPHDQSAEDMIAGVAELYGAAQKT